MLHSWHENDKIYINTSGTSKTENLSNSPDSPYCGCAFGVPGGRMPSMCLMCAHHYGVYNLNVRTQTVPTPCRTCFCNKSSLLWLNMKYEQFFGNPEMF